MHVDELTDQARVVGAEVDHPVDLGAALEHAGVLLRVVADQDALQRADHASAVFGALLADALLQDRQALLLQFFRGVVAQVRCRGAGARAVDEGIGEVEADLLDQFHGLLEIFLGFAGEADDEVRADQDVRHRRAQLADARLVLERGVVALHGRKDAIGARLHRQMQVFHQLGDLGMGLDQRVGEFQRMAGGVADAVDTVDDGYGVEQLGEVGDLPILGRATVAVDVLPEQGDFTHAVFGQVDDLAEYIGHGSADFFAAGVGHHAEGAVLAAAFHHRHVGAGAIDARLGQTVEFLDLGEADVDLGDLGGTRGVDHFRQAVQGLRAEDHVDVGRAITNRRAFLAGHAAADADHQVGVGNLQLLPTAELREHLVLGFFTDRAGVEHDDVSVCGLLCDFQGLMFAQQVDHARAVVLVHLATVGFDIKLLGHARSKRVIRRTAHYRELVPGFLALAARRLCYDPRPYN